MVSVNLFKLDGVKFYIKVNIIYADLETVKVDIKFNGFYFLDNFKDLRKVDRFWWLRHIFSLSYILYRYSLGFYCWIG